MSEEEKFKEIIQEINEIYIFLTQQEPTPDDEIEARVKLIEKTKTLITLNAPQVTLNMRLFESALSGLENWETLDLWFIESELPGLIQSIINLGESESKPSVPEEPKEQIMPSVEPNSKTELEAEIETETEGVLKPDRFDINEIVSKVSEQFKGEIDGLKQKIDVLKHELDKKEESLRNGSSKRIIKTIRPKKNVKLPPPKIKIPIIKGPKIPPKIKIPIIKGPKASPKIKIPVKLSPKTPTRINIKEKIGLEELSNQKGTNSIKQVQAQIAEELQKLTITPVFDEESKIKQEQLKEPESIIDILEESKTLPPPPEPEFKLKQPEKSESIFDILEESKPLTPPPEFKSVPEDTKVSVEPEGSEEPDLFSEIMEEIGPIPAIPSSDFLTEIPKEFDPDINIIEELDPPTKSPELDFNSALPSNMPKLEIPELVEKLDQKVKLPEPSVVPEKPEELKKNSVISEVTLTEVDANDEKPKVPFMAKKPKIATVSVEEVDTKYMKSSGTDLFNVFSSVGDKKTKKSISNLELFSEIPTKQKKKEAFELPENTNVFPKFSSPTPELPESDELKPFSIEELPTDKDSLYQELIALEGKRYSIEKNYKVIEKKYHEGSIDEVGFNKQNNELKIKLDEITSRINKIRRFITSL